MQLKCSNSSSLVLGSLGYRVMNVLLVIAFTITFQRRAPISDWIFITCRKSMYAINSLEVGSIWLYTNQGSMVLVFTLPDSYVVAQWYVSNKLLFLFRCNLRNLIFCYVGCWVRGWDSRIACGWQTRSWISVWKETAIQECLLFLQDRQGVYHWCHSPGGHSSVCEPFLPGIPPYLIKSEVAAEAFFLTLVTNFFHTIPRFFDGNIWFFSLFSVRLN